MNETNEMNDPGAIQPGISQLPPAPLVLRPVYEAGARERVLLVLALGLGILAADLFLSVGWNFWGLGILVGTAAWYGVFLWYVGPRKLTESRTRLFFAAILLLALTFVLFSNTWFRFWNTGLLLVLLTVHAFQISGAGRKPWFAPSMLWERFLLLMDGLFGRLGALGAAIHAAGYGGEETGEKGEKSRRGAMAGLGLLVSIPLLLIAAALLGQADLLFRKLTSNVMDSVWSHSSQTIVRVLLGLLAAPFLFSLLYALGLPKPLEEKKAGKVYTLDSIVGIIVLGSLDILYLFFVGVQSSALFGGADYLAAMGISYAEYARSGFFQLTFVTFLNLAVVLTLLHFTGREGKGWRAARILSTALILLSGVILVSAAWRMTLYVLAYGLSFKRALTYWGMVMIALLLGAACVKAWRQEFRFFRFAAVAALAGWLLLNYANVDRIVMGYNVNAYLSGSLAQVDLLYLSNLSYEALPVLEEKLDWETVIKEPSDRDTDPDGALTLEDLLKDRAAQAVWECSQWETWSIPAWEWSVGWDE